MKSIDALCSESVFLNEDGEPVTTSIAVAKHTGRTRREINRSIRELRQFGIHRCKFAPIYVNDSYNRSIEAFTITEFELFQLAGSFQGQDGYDARTFFWERFQEIKRAANQMHKQIKEGKVLHLPKPKIERNHGFKFNSLKYTGDGMVEATYTEGSKKISEMNALEYHSFIMAKSLGLALGNFKKFAGLIQSEAKRHHRKVVDTMRNLENLRDIYRAPKVNAIGKQKPLFPELE